MATGAVRATPETRKKTKMQRGRAFVARVFLKLSGGSNDVVFQLANQVDLLPHDTTVLQLRTGDSMTNNDSLELLVDSEQHVAGVKYIMTPEKHQAAVDSLITHYVTDQVFNRFAHVGSLVDQREPITL